MSIGSSGRVVIEIQPEIKQELHTVLRLEGTNLKTWFMEQVEELLAQKGQKALPLDNPTHSKKSIPNEV